MDGSVVWVQVQRLRATFGPSLMIHARARDIQHLIELENAGASYAVADASVSSLRLGARVLKGICHHFVGLVRVKFRKATRSCKQAIQPHL